MRQESPALAREYESNTGNDIASARHSLVVRFRLAWFPAILLIVLALFSKLPIGASIHAGTLAATPDRSPAFSGERGIGSMSAANRASNARQQPAAALANAISALGAA
jgi:hypothetical protein